MQVLLDAGISTRRGIMCSHREPAYADLPHAPLAGPLRARAGRSILLPLFPGMTADDQSRVLAALRRACDAAHDLAPSPGRMAQPITAE